MSNNRDTYKPLRDEDISEIPPLEIPEFKPDIPDFILNQQSNEMKWLFEQVSSQGKKLDFLLQVEMDSNKNIRKTNGKVIRLRKFQDSATPTLKRVEEIEKHLETYITTKSWLRSTRGILVTVLTGLAILFSALNGILKFFAMFQ